MTFLSAGLLGGLLLAAVPIIIHILNRRRFLVIDWPPMKYLKLTLKKNRRRVRLEQMILLAMRTLAVILLILAVARPVLSQGGLGRFLPGRGRTSRVVVLDDSLSMGYTVEGRSAFQVAQNAAEDLIRTAGGQDSLSLLVTSAPNRPLVRDAAMQDARKYADLVAGLSQTETPSNWASTFQGIQKALTQAAFASKEVVLITDLRRNGWTEQVTALADQLASERVGLRIIDVGARRTDDVALTKLEVEDAIALPSQAVHLRAVIRNGTASGISGGRATLTVDKDSRPVLLPELPAGSTIEVPLTVTLEKPGEHIVSLNLAQDALPGDDTRYLTLNVRPTVSIVMVDGEISAQPFDSETDFLALACSVGTTPWKVERVGDFDVRRFRPGAPDMPDVMILANVASLNAPQAAALQQLVAKGMGLMIFTGELVDAQAYNRTLFANGGGLLPLKLGRASETPTSGIVIEKEAQSPLASLAKLLPAALARVRTRQYTAVDTPAVLPDGVSLLAHWNNAENPVAVAQKIVGRGRVLLFTTTAGKRWTDWPLDPTYVLGMRSAILALARSQQTAGGVVAGDVLRLPLGPGKSAIGPTVTLPYAALHAAPESAQIAPVADGGGGGTLLSFDGTPRAGVYAMAWKDEKGAPQKVHFSVNPPVQESDLTPISQAQLASLLGNLKVTIQRYDTNGAGLGSPAREMWRPLAMILLALMLAETAFAVFVGRDR